jgi:hypothetical protein
MAASCLAGAILPATIHLWCLLGPVSPWTWIPIFIGALKMMAASKGVTMREFCIAAIRQRIESGKAIGPDPLLEELWDNEEDAVYDDL